jgi:hypothetical protein
MNIELNISGYFQMEIYKTNGDLVHEEKELQEILSKLQTSEYVIGMKTGEIRSLDDFSTVLYTFKLDPTDSVEYDFDEE